MAPPPPHGAPATGGRRRATVGAAARSRSSPACPLRSRTILAAVAEMPTNLIGAIAFLFGFWAAIELLLPLVT